MAEVSKADDALGGSVEVVVVIVEAGTADDALEGSVEVVV